MMADEPETSPGKAGTAERQRQKQRRASGKIGGALQFAEIGVKSRKQRLLTLHGVDGRTMAYRETKRLITEIESDLGGTDRLSAAMRQLIQHAAVLGALMTDAEIRYLGGAEMDVSSYNAMVNVQRRCFEAIGLSRVPRNITPNLAEYLEATNEAPAAQGAEAHTDAAQDGAG
jgi:hypothetical protein